MKRMPVSNRLVPLILLLFVAACDKDDDMPYSPAQPYSWRLGGQVYYATNVKSLPGVNAVSAIDGIPNDLNKFDLNTMTVYFRSLPLLSGKYRIVSYGSPGSLGPNDVYIFAGKYFGTASSNDYWTYGYYGDSVTVTVTANRIGIKVPIIYVKSKFDLNDSIRLSANIMEN